MSDSEKLRAGLPTRLLLSGTTALALIFTAPMAYAQASEDPGDEIRDTFEETDEEDEVVATGIRNALKEARDLKRNADTAVDSITASDVSTLPDLSVAEALARVPGVVVQRINLTERNGGDFPSPEGGGNLIRGLTLVRSEFNGRDAFSANGGRSLDFGTVPPELIGAVDVYKNTSADLIEGGIGGSINLRTLEPFDRNGLIAVATIDGTYTDLRDEVAPDFSVILGDRWDTDAGEFGLLGSFSSSELKSDLNGFQIGALAPIPVGDERIAVPGGFQLRTNEVDRKRDSYYVAGQYQNAEGTFKATAKYAYIENETEGNERTLEWFPDGESFPPGGDNTFLTGESLTNIVGDITTTPFSTELSACNGANDRNPQLALCETQFPVTGLYESGVISNNLRDWIGADGANFTNLGINQQDRSTTDDLSLNLQWRPADQWYVNLDAHTTSATFDRQRLWGGTRFFSNFVLNADLDNPQVQLVGAENNNPRRRFQDGSNLGAWDGGDPLSGELTDPNNSFLLFSADEFQENDGNMYAVRGDIEYEFDNDGWFDAVKFGARVSEREQTNRSAGLNWAAVAPPWDGATGSTYLPLAQLSSQGFEEVSYDDFFRGGVVTGDNTSVLFVDRNLLSDYNAWVSSLAAEPLIAQRTNEGDAQFADWRPLRQNGVIDFADRGQIGDIIENTTQFYGRMDFGQEFENGMSIDANIGVRYTESTVSGTGGLRFNEIEDNSRPGQRTVDFAPEAVAYFDQDNTQISGIFSEDDRWLPSVNVKWNLNDNHLIRFGASQNITRPRIDQLRADQSTGGSFRREFVINPDAEPGSDNASLTTDIALTSINVFGGNPDLKPILADNYDLSYETYWGDENSFTFNLFQKDIRNNIIYSSQTLDVITLDGDQVPIVFNGEVNQDEAKLQGFEVAYQQFYDFLPGLLSNLGLQANYTYIDSETNAPVPFTDADGDGAPDDFERIFRYGVDNFLGLSNHAANVVGIYQDDTFEFRLAYNWRSEYLSAYRDFVSGNPIFQEDRGYLDGSIKYDMTDNLQLRLQVANILDTEAQATQQINAQGDRFGRTNFLGDRRVRFGLRFQY